MAPYSDTPARDGATVKFPGYSYLESLELHYDGPIPPKARARAEELDRAERVAAAPVPRHPIDDLMLQLAVARKDARRWLGYVRAEKKARGKVFASGDWQQLQGARRLYRVIWKGVHAERRRKAIADTILSDIRAGRIDAMTAGQQYQSRVGNHVARGHLNQVCAMFEDAARSARRAA